MKQRFSSLDRIFLFKFAKPDQRQSLVIDSGFRCHLTEFSRATAAAPSAFVARLRKFLKTRRVTSVAQIGTDRIIELQFSDGQYRLFLEFYAGGNIVLTDKDLGILGLLRVVHEESEELRVGLKYLLDNRQNYGGVPNLTPERIRAGLQKSVDRTEGEAVSSQKKAKRKSGDALRKALATSLNEFPPMLIDHALEVAAFDSTTLVDEVLKDTPTMERLMVALGEAQKVLNNISSSEVHKGYILAKPVKSAAAEGPVEASGQLARENLMYDDFHPFRPQQFVDNPDITILQFEGFNRTVDEFFSSIESQKLESRLTEREEHAKRKLEAARRDQEKRLGGLQQVQEMNVRKAQAIEANLQKVQEAIAAVNGLLAQGMDWMDVARLIEMEQERHNVVAEMIRLPLKLYENTATLLLAESSYEEEDDYSGDETGSDVSDSDDDQAPAAKTVKAPKPIDKRLAIDVDLALSPWSNARQYYDQKKSAAVKEQKTLQSSEKALRSTEKKINADLKKGLKQEKEVMRPQRKAHWFEKFVYFISSEGYLVLGGKDAQQNEILYQRYLKKGDVFIHADLPGAATIVVKNKPGMSESPIPPSTLSQAGTLAVATSNAWDSKAVMSAWWVNTDQVSKTALTGEYLTTGNFTVRGNKNFLPPAQLLLGFGIMFKISEESKTRHLKHRFQETEFFGPTSTPQVSKAENPVLDEKDHDDNETGSNEDQHSLSEDESFEAAGDYEAEGAASDNDEDENSVDDDFKQENPLQPKANSYTALQSLIRQNKETMLGTDQELKPSDSESVGEDSERQEQLGEQEEEQTDSIPAEKDGQIRHLSTKQRQLLKKGQGSFSSGKFEGSNVNVNAEADTQLSTSAASTQSLNLASQSSTKSQASRVRGKHGKRNKLKTKYANQDEEDRALAMRLLGSGAAQEKAIEDAAAKANKEQELAAQKERRRKQHALAAEKGKEAEEKRKLNFEEGLETGNENEIEELGDLDAFIGAPLPGDEILDALVVCGPWDAIGSRCRWRVKIQPGSTKKGKAVREILHTWFSAINDQEKKRRPAGGEGNEGIVEEEKVRIREAELIKAIREAEVIGVVPVGKVRIAMKAADGAGKGKGGGAGKGKRGGKGSKKH
ncbi:nuclear export mediator factor NEMF, partial [Lecanoromycetidae sp. Uapishka_2]